MGEQIAQRYQEKSAQQNAAAEAAAREAQQEAVARATGDLVRQEVEQDAKEAKEAETIREVEQEAVAEATGNLVRQEVEQEAKEAEVARQKATADLQQAKDKYYAQFGEVRDLIAKLKQNSYFSRLYEEAKQKSQEYEDGLKELQQRVIEGTASENERNNLIMSEVFQDITYATRAINQAQKDLNGATVMSQEQAAIKEAKSKIEILEAAKKKIANKRQPLSKKLEEERQQQAKTTETSAIKQPVAAVQPTTTKVKAALPEPIQQLMDKKGSKEQIIQDLSTLYKTSELKAAIDNLKDKIAAGHLENDARLAEEMAKLREMQRERNEHIEELAGIIHNMSNNNKKNNKKAERRENRLPKLLGLIDKIKCDSQIASIEKALDEAKKTAPLAAQPTPTKAEEKQPVAAAQPTPAKENKSIFDKIKERFSSKKTYKVTNRRKSNNLDKLKIKIAAAATTVALLITGIVGINVARRNSNPSPDDVYPTEEYVQENSDTDTPDTDIFDTDIEREVDTDDQVKEESTDEEKEEEDKKEETPDSDTEHDKEKEEEPDYYRFTVAIQEGAPIYDDMYDAKNETSPYSRYFSDDTKRYAETIVWEDSDGQLNNTEASQWKDQGRIVAVSTSVESSQDIKGRVERTEGFFSINDVTIYDQELNPISIGGGMRR